MKPKQRIIGSREFTDGGQRAVCEDDEERHFVIDDQGRPVNGAWLLADEPAVVPHLTLRRPSLV